MRHGTPAFVVGIVGLTATLVGFALTHPDAPVDVVATSPASTAAPIKAELPLERLATTSSNAAFDVITLAIGSPALATAGIRLFDAPVANGAVASDPAPSAASKIVVAKADTPKIDRTKLAALRTALDRIRGTRSIEFASGLADLTPDRARLIEELAPVIKAHAPATIRVVGHTDSTGDESANVVLSRLRAEAVRRLLIEKGVPPQQVAASGLGSAKPIADNETPDGQRANRRIEWVVNEDKQ